MFPPLRQGLEASTKKGIYIIENSKGIVLHVGNTPRAKNGIYQRLKNHLSGSSSFTRSYFGGKGAKLRSNCTYRYIEVASARKRALLECYAIGKLCPKHLGLG